jgi:hypothetical protein
MPVGKIKGEMLENNLLRNNVDLAFDTSKIYLNVASKYVGINTSTPFRDLTVSGTTRVTAGNSLIVPTRFSSSALDITGTQIQNTNGSIVFTPTGPTATVTMPQLTTDGLKLYSNYITTTRSNENIDINATGTGLIKLNANTELYGDLRVTGNVTFDGSITFGNADTDNVSFGADVSSDIIPNIDNTYSLGSNTKRWGTVYTRNLNGVDISTSGFSAGGVDLTKRQGKIWYVATLGSYNYVGNHQNAPFDTIERALANATNGDTVFIYPGTYTELLPLTVPAGVTVKGHSLRSVIIQPDTSSTNKDVFLVNGQCTIEDVTIRNFYYNSIADTGYAFRFANNFNTTSRSPYIRNVTVITQGSVTSGTDPRGFNTGDAGRGALIDGSVANVATTSASMLFHSATFITPGVDCIIMKNGARVEWLNSFIYYANRGLYAQSGTTGLASAGKTRLKVYGMSANTVVAGNTISVENVSQANTYTTATIQSITYSGGYAYITIAGKVTGWETSKSFPVETANQQRINFAPGGQTASYLVNVDYSDFGAEIRSIASANVYGNYGAWADGPGTLMYLIGHNFAYIGVGKDTNNDKTASIQANQVIQANTGKIYYQNLDHKGLFEVGSVFSVDGDTGKIAFSPTSFNVTGLTGFEFTSGSNTTIINAASTRQNNILIQDRSILSISGAINFTPVSGILNLNANIANSTDLAVTQSATFSTVTIGDQNTDTFTINSTISASLVPTNNNGFDIGSSTNYWNNIYAGQYLLDNIEINDNYIRTTVSNSNLELRANGTGVVNVDQIGIKSNTISTITTNSDLQITPNGTGKIQLQKNTVANTNLSTSGNLTAPTITIGSDATDVVNFNSTLSNNLVPTFNNSADIGSTTNYWQNVYAGQLLLDSLEINDNYIRTTASNSNLELRPNGTGIVAIDQLGIKSNVISTTATNTDLQINPNGTGKVQLLKNTAVTGNLDVSGSVAVIGTVTFGDALSDSVTFNFSVNSSLIPTNNNSYDLGLSTNYWRNIYAGQVLTDNIELNDNYVRTTVSNSNLELRPNGTGVVSIDQLGIKSNAITSTATNTDIQINPNGTGKVQLLKNTAVTGNLDISSAFNVTGTMTFGDAITDSVTFNNAINSNLIPLYNNSYDVGITTNYWRNVYAGQFLTDNIEVNDNYVRTTVSNSNLELRANGTGLINIDQLGLKSNTVSSTSTNTDIQINPNGTGKVQLLKDTVVTGNLDVSGNTLVTGNVQLGDQIIDSINVVGKIASDLSPAASYTYDLGSTTQVWNDTYLGQILLDSLEINDNYIRTTVSNANLDLRANGTGVVSVDQLGFKSNLISTIAANTDLQINPNGTGTIQLLKNTAVTGRISVSGSTTNNSLTTFGDTNGDRLYLTTVNGSLIPTTNNFADIGSPVGVTYNIDFTALAQADLAVAVGTVDTPTKVLLNSTVPGSIYRYGDVNNDGNVTANDGLAILKAATPTFDATLTASGYDWIINVIIPVILSDPITYSEVVIQSPYNYWRNIYAGQYLTDNIEINDNYVRTTVSNSDLELRANGTGSVVVDQLNFKSNTIVSNSTNTDIQINPNGTGKVKLNKDTVITGNLFVSGNTQINSNLILGDTVVDTVNFVGRVNSNLIPAANHTYDLGSSTLQWNDIYIGRAVVDGIEINDNYIRTTISNANLELRANGTGAVELETLRVNSATVTPKTTNTDIQFNNQTRITGTNAAVLPLGSNATRLLNTGEVRFNNSTNQFEGLLPGGNAATIGYWSSAASPNPTGTWSPDTSTVSSVSQLEFHNITYSGQNSSSFLSLITTGFKIVLFKGQYSNLTDYAVYDVTGAFNVGTGYIYTVTYNSKVGIPSNTWALTNDIVSVAYFGIGQPVNVTNGTNLRNLYGLSDIDQNTTITPENTIGASDGTIRMYINGTQKVTINSSQVTTSPVVVDDIRLSLREIATVNSNADLTFDPNGTGSVNLKDLAVRSNRMTDTNSSGARTITSTGTGYVRFMGQGAVAIPSGTTAQQPTGAAAELGMHRWNTDLARLEVYDGTNWVSAIGTASGVSADLMGDITDVFALIFG